MLCLNEGKLFTALVPYGVLLTGMQLKGYLGYPPPAPGPRPP